MMPVAGITSEFANLQESVVSVLEHRQQQAKKNWKKEAE